MSPLRASVFFSRDPLPVKKQHSGDILILRIRKCWCLKQTDILELDCVADGLVPSFRHTLFHGLTGGLTPVRYKTGGF